MLMLRAILLAVVLGVPATLYSATTRASSLLDRFFGYFKVPVQESIQFIRLSDNKIIYELSPEKSLRPASVTKLVTAAAALTRFTPERTFSTKFYYTGTRNDGTISGDLIIVGDGDPYIVSEKLWQLAADVSHLGIKRIRGGIIIDNSLFDGEDRDTSRQSSTYASSHAYDSPVSAFGINFNTFAVAVAPGDKEGTARVSMDPYELRAVKLENGVKTMRMGDKGNINASRVSDLSGYEKLVMQGRIGLDSSLVKVYRSVGDHVKASGEYVRAFFAHAGVIIEGAVREGRLDSSAQFLIDLKSYDMARIIAGLNKFSNNYIADVMFKRLGAAFPQSGAPDRPGSGTLANGVAAIDKFLRGDVGVSGLFRIENGSGLSTDNRLSARQLNQVLTFMERHLDLFPEYLASLPASGWDGTLSDRFSKGDAEKIRGQVRAKTGTLTEPVAVTSLAGYMRHPEHGWVAFTIIENGLEGQRQPNIIDLRKRQDDALAGFLTQ